MNEKLRAARIRHLADLTLHASYPRDLLAMEELVALALASTPPAPASAVRYEEAKWWAAGDHAAKYEDSGCEIKNCRKCQRLATLQAAAQKGTEKK